MRLQQCRRVSFPGQQILGNIQGSAGDLRNLGQGFASGTHVSGPAAGRLCESKY